MGFDRESYHRALKEGVSYSRDNALNATQRIFGTFQLANMNSASIKSTRVESGSNVKSSSEFYCRKAAHRHV